MHNAQGFLDNLFFSCAEFSDCHYIVLCFPFMMLFLLDIQGVIFAPFPWPSGFLPSWVLIT